MTPDCRHRSPAPVAIFPAAPVRNLYHCDCAAATPHGVTTLRFCARCPLVDSNDCELREHHAADAAFWRRLGIPGGCAGC